MGKSVLFVGFLLVFLGLALPGTQAKVFSRCDLVKTLRGHGFEGFVGKTVADCEYNELLFYLSAYTTLIYPEHTLLFLLWDLFSSCRGLPGET